jgi:hypothetical protein
MMDTKIITASLQDDDEQDRKHVFLHVAPMNVKNNPESC